MGEILGGQFPVFGGLVLLVGGAIVFFIGTLHGERRLMINGAVILLVAVLSLVAGLMLTKKNAVSDPWQQFAQAHHCQIVQKRQGHSNLGVAMTPTLGPMGLLLGDDTPDKTAYKCDDGVTYWRNDK